eukprot:gene54938-210_t
MRAAAVVAAFAVGADAWAGNPFKKWGKCPALTTLGSEWYQRHDEFNGDATGTTV